MTYSGKSFHIRKCIGEFERDEDGNAIIEKAIDQDGTIHYKDVYDRRVNSKGYLIDEYDNIIHKNGNILFEKREMKDDGEIPKIFNFIEFDFDGIKPTSMSDLNPVDMRDSSVKVNQKGYNIDDQGNIIDKHGNIVIQKYLISESGEIPKVFRLGMVNSSVRTSLEFTNGVELKHKKSGSVNVTDFHPKQEDMISRYQTIDEEEEKTIVKDEVVSKAGENKKMRDKPSNYNGKNLETYEGLLDDHSEGQVESEEIDQEPEPTEQKDEGQVVKASISFDDNVSII